MSNEVICPYCCMGALRMTGRELYPAKPELANKHYFACRNCDAWIGCKDGTWEPVGRLADAALRRAKKRVNDAVEPSIVTRSEERRVGKGCVSPGRTGR